MGNGKSRYAIKASLAGLCLTAALLAGCGTPSSNSSPPAAADAAKPPPADTAPANQSNQQNLSVAELLGTPASSPSAAPTATAIASPPTTGGASDAGNVVAESTVRDSSAEPAGDNDAEFARVVSVNQIPGPRQVCTDQTVVERRHPRDEHHVAGTVIGAVVGGVVGNQFGRGSGRTLATVGGAVAGGAIGRNVQRDNESRQTTTRVVRHCRPVTGTQAGVSLFDVVYAYQGQNFHVRLDHDPGDRLQLPVRGVE